MLEELVGKKVAIIVAFGGAITEGSIPTYITGTLLDVNNEYCKVQATEFSNFSAYKTLTKKMNEANKGNVIINTKYVISALELSE